MVNHRGKSGCRHRTTLIEGVAGIRTALAHQFHLIFAPSLLGSEEPFHVNIYQWHQRVILGIRLLHQFILCLLDEFHLLFIEFLFYCRAIRQEVAKRHVNRAVDITRFDSIFVHIFEQDRRCRVPYAAPINVNGSIVTGITVSISAGQRIIVISLLRHVPKVTIATPALNQR